MQTALDLQMKFVLSRSTPTIVGGGGGEGGLYWHKVWTTMTRRRANNERSHELKQVTRVRTRYMVAEYRMKVQTIEYTWELSISAESCRSKLWTSPSATERSYRFCLHKINLCYEMSMSWGPAQLSCWWQRGYVGRLRNQSNFESVHASKGSGSNNRKD